MSGPHVVALGGGHGLAVTLQALRRVTDELTAVVTVADDGGSSGRLRREFGVLPPGDLRMALASLCGDDDWGRTWARVLQHRFSGGGDLDGHAVGNLLIVALWELLDGDHVQGLEWVSRLLGAKGRVLPMAAVPLDIEAWVAGLDPTDRHTVRTVRGQASVATTPGQVVAVRLLPEAPPAHPEVLAAIDAADWVVLGPGSWFTSVIPHLLVPDLAQALIDTKARRLVTLNLSPQLGETAGFLPENLLEVLALHAPDLDLDVVIADPSSIGDETVLRRVAADLGATVQVADVSTGDGSARHDPQRLARVLADVFGVAGSMPWR